MKLLQKVTSYSNLSYSDKLLPNTAEIVSGSGICCAICNIPPFLMPNQQRQSTEGN